MELNPPVNNEATSSVAPVQSTTTEPEKGSAQTPKTPKLPWICVLISGIIAIAGLAFGIYGMTKPAETAIDNCENKAENTNSGTVSDDSSAGFKINETGLTIKNLENAGVITSYTYHKSGSAPDEPLSSFEILSFKGVPDVATDFVEGISGAIIYEYNPEYFFDPATECDVTLGTIGQSESSFCIKRKPAEGAALENDAKDAWETWSESNIEALMEVLSNKDNYTYNK